MKQQDRDKTIEVMDPVGEFAQVTRHLAKRPSQLRGKVVGLVANESVPMQLLEAIAEVLADKYGVAETVRVLPTPRHLLKAEAVSKLGSNVADKLDDVAKHCDAALVGVGY